ncbi:neuronal acetylcholine receptor subunit beta-3-like [Crassostrea angulata]|uniref:neuronal acetylcholine receptor subunit beta-3-like n=1 Tax=Magallana angulata TaxID=2784310 RepID=UPI0022B18BA0|nr:neuronal acetylcholine receptor subunit beta-3-like [Crassostrea angulata]
MNVSPFIFTAMFLWSYTTVCCHDNETIDNESILQEKLFKNYNRYRKPVKVSSNRIFVSLTLDILSLPKLDIKSQTLHAANWLTYSWTDEYLTWNSSVFSNIDYVRLPADKIWIPSVCNLQEISGRRCLTYDSVKDSRSEAVIHSSGQVYLTETMDSIVLCKFDALHFPFDTQTCIFSFISSTGRFQKTYLAVNKSSYESRYFIGNEEWDLISTNVQAKFDMLNMKIVLKRRPLFIVLTVVLPIVALSIMNAFCFLLPIESGEKMGTSVALFLTFAVFGTIISDTMPQNAANISWFMVYVTTQILLSGLTVIMETVVLHLYHKYAGRSETIYIDKVCTLHNANNKTKDKSKEKYECVIAKTKATDSEEMWKSRAKKLDRVMMILNVCANIISICICMTIIMI